MRLLLGLNLASPLSVVGLIWFVPSVLSPATRDLRKGPFLNHPCHLQRLATFAVDPFMLAEAPVAFGGLFRQPSRFSRPDCGQISC
jgi:hypothetical protein